MRYGACRLTLHPDTPADITRQIRRYDQLVVLPSRIPHLAHMGRSEIIAQARYRGVLLEESDEGLVWDGAGLGWLLSDADDIGHHWTEVIPYTPMTWAQHLSVMESLNGFGGLTRQSVIGAGSIGTFPSSSSVMADVPRPYFKRLVWLAETMGAEFRIDAQGRFHSGGKQSGLFRGQGSAAPGVIAAYGLAGQDHQLLGLQVVEWDPRRIGHAAAKLAYVRYGAAYAFAAQAISPSPGGADGLPVRRDIVDIRSSDSSTDAAQRAAGLLGNAVPTVELRIGVGDSDPARIITAGDFIHVYWPTQGFVDVGEATTYQGRVIPCARMRVHALRAPIEQQQGVYVLGALAASGRLLDVSDYVVVTDTTAQLELGRATDPIRTFT